MVSTFHVRKQRQPGIGQPLRCGGTRSCSRSRFARLSKLGVETHPLGGRGDLGGQRWGGGAGDGEALCPSPTTAFPVLPTGFLPHGGHQGDRLKFRLHRSREHWPGMSSGGFAGGDGVLHGVCRAGGRPRSAPIKPAVTLPSSLVLLSASARHLPRPTYHGRPSRTLPPPTPPVPSQASPLHPDAPQRLSLSRDCPPASPPAHASPGLPGRTGLSSLLLAPRELPPC